MILLDLFSGSRSWSKAFEELDDCECLSLDNDPKHRETTWVVDIHEWEPPERLIGNVDVVCIGVPCTAYSTACKKKTPARFQATRELWLRSFEIARRVLKPNGVMVCENPSRTELTGCKSQPIGDMEIMRPDLFKCEINYCRYSTADRLYPWKKTTLWSNVSLIDHGFVPRLCNCDTRCEVGSFDPRTQRFKHALRMSFAPERCNRGRQSSAWDWSSMPHQLCCEVRDACLNAIHA